ncbi:MAG: acyl carrier protein [Clostridiales bacterium]|nr:acyl carrier protein [Clostridiales bacterium]
MNFDELKDIIADTLGCDEDKITPEASLTDDLEADSLDAMEINMAIEEKSGIAIPDEALTEMKTVGDILDYISKQN